METDERVASVLDETRGPLMRIWVCYVTHEKDLGSYVLGARVSQEGAKDLAQHHIEGLRQDGTTMEWHEYHDHNSEGVQCINEEFHVTYYVEETELDFSSLDVTNELISRLKAVHADLGRFLTATGA